ncbi:MAG: DUF11 domain-containing protein [Chloroflexia bacterium]
MKNANSRPGVGEPPKPVGYFCIVLGLLLILASFHSPWGKAYGQTVVTPTPGVAIGDPQISKTGQPDCCNPGDPVTFIIVVTNVGNADVTNVLISDTLPAELTLQTVTTTKGLVTVQGNHFEVRIDRIAPGEIVTITVHAVVSEGAPTDIVVTNTAYLFSDQGTRQASAQVLIKPPGGCPTPPILPPTGPAAPEPREGTSLWLLIAGLVLLLLGVVLSIRTRKRSPAEET